MTMTNASGGPTALSRLGGLLDVTRLIRSDADVTTVLAELARILREALGYRMVVMNLYRPAWDDFWVAAVEGSEEARAALLGATYDRSTWDRILDPVFQRRGAYPIRAGELEWTDLGARWSPRRPGSASDDAWQPEDELFVPFRHTDGHLLGVLSLGEPVSGKRPTDEELDVLVAMAGHAALAVQGAQEASDTAQHERALKQLLRVSASLVGTGWELPDLLQTVTDSIASALGFERVALVMVEGETGRLVPRASTGWTLADQVFEVQYELSDVQPLLDTAFEVAGCYLLSSDAALARVPARLIGHRSESNGRGPYAWSHHWLVVPLRDASGDTIGLIWADDPIDRLLPSEARLEALRTFANQAAAAIEANGREAKLRLSEERFRKVFEEGPLGMKLIGPDLRFVDMNESFCRLLGYSRAELRGRSIEDVTHEEDTDIDADLAGQLFRGEIPSYRLEKRYHTKSGGVIWVDLAATVIRNERGEPAYGLGIVEDVTERRRVGQELEQAHEARRDMLKRVVEVAESERRRLAADLHDGPIQRISALTVRLETARLAAAREDWAACTRALALTQENLQGEVNRLRRLMKDLRPPVLDERGLTVALRGLAEEVRSSSGLRVTVSAPSGHLPDLEPERETALYRIAQEALTNVIKHARATEASISVSMEGRIMRIEITDDGTGFDPDGIVVADGHFGLVTMRERAEMAGGTLSIETRGRRGTCVRVLVPLSARVGRVA